MKEVVDGSYPKFSEVCGWWREMKWFELTRLLFLSSYEWFWLKKGLRIRRERFFFWDRMESFREVGNVSQLINVPGIERRRSLLPWNQSNGLPITFLRSDLSQTIKPYSFEKIIPLLSYWYFPNLIHTKIPPKNNILKFNRIPRWLYAKKFTKFF